jgi:Uncharacterized protein conserved in bacteria containing a divergent form of TPR repeats
MKQFRNPVFAIGILGLVIFLAGVFILNNNQHYGYIVLITGIGLAAISSLITLIEVARSHRLKGQKKVIWLVIVFLLPIVGGFMYYIFSGTNEERTID